MKQTVFHALNRCDRLLTLGLKWICIGLFAAITVILTLNIIVRFVPVMSMHWFDEILELLYGALIFYGAAAVWVIHGHFSVGDWISKHLSSVRARFAYRLIVELLSLVFIAVFFWYALDLFLKTEEQTTAFAMSKKWLYACMPITGGVMVLYSLKNMYLELLKIVNPALDIEAGRE
ncbi:TRAP transporter small permease [Propionivibrio sp.]|jgi:TRAP-type C4-dicarboxylate transport system permease small subunit|uniref:TRAP transporter small permease n=1 Tax=Propionivibrio sp. TaxID=2212460 RepID=UPI00272EA901|nr:TRAP transporter small permease subunit [Propionivibrio sp.]